MALIEAPQQIDRFLEFFDENYKSDLLKKESLGERYLVVDFAILSKFDPELAEDLLKEPEEVIRAAELSLDKFDLKNLRVRFSNLPANQEIRTRDVRSKHMGQFLFVNGLVRQKSDVRPQVTSSKYECPNCGNIINVLQLNPSMKEPSSCGCGRKGKFSLISKELVDAQGIVLEEIPETLEGGEQPKRINVFLKEDLVSPITEKKTNPGSKIRVSGIIKEVPVLMKSGIKSTRIDYILEANFVDTIEENFMEIEISKKEEEQIIELAKNPDIFQILARSIVPSIYGYKEVKEALVLQLMGGVRKERGDGVVTRGDMHILLVGDPGAGKSQILKRISSVAPKGRYVSGKGVTGAGLTAAVVRDEFLGGWSLEAGALVLANNGVCSIDEMDKMSHEDRGAMHEALEQQTISISKANIQATLLARTTVLAAANPKFGRFDAYDVIANQIDMPPTLINRFDLIFPIKDIPNETKDDKTASHILKLHKEPDAIDPEIDTQLLKKYFAYARQRVKPKLTDDAVEHIKNFYVQMRNAESSDDRAMRSVPISARQLEALVRMAEASAKVTLSEEVQKKDAQKAIDLLTYCLLQIGVDKETGKIDIDRITTGIPASQRDKIHLLKDILAELEQTIGKAIPIEEVTKKALELSISESDTDQVIEKLKRAGDIFEPRHGFLQRL